MTEFHYYTGDEFAIEIELFEEDNLVEQLTKLVRAYRSHHSVGQARQMPARDTSGSNAAEEESRIGAREDATYVRSMLWALFGKQIDERMHHIEEGAESAVMVALKESLLRNRSALSSQRQVFASVRACSDRLRELTVDPRVDELEPPDDPISWPYIRAIK